ncbi:hypothetical protein ZWY2020_016119 [Hordeum vulgare]|nr:hypothetical protein ZWY2020_016119 [Hordeum vulgare]
MGLNSHERVHRMENESVLERILNGEEEPKDLPLPLLQHITRYFSEERRIGHGGFGVVYKGVLRSGVIVAVKRIDVNEHTIDDKLFLREFNTLRKINHRNVVRFLGFCSNSYQTPLKDAHSEEINLANVRERLLCFEYISGGSLDMHITDELRGLEWEIRYDIIIGICKGLRYLHEEKRIIHMDLKPANILLDGIHMVPKITDFGLSRPNKKSHTMGLRFGTRGYLAPEYEKAGKTSVKSDIYSLGAIIIELVTGCMGIPDKHNVLRRWRHRWSKPPSLIQYRQVTKCIDLAVWCRQQEPGHRPSISEIISTLTESESMDVHIDQISPCFDEDDMLGIKPLELQLPFELNKDISCFTVELTNDTRSCIAFNIQLPSGQQYYAQPDRGIVQPGSKYGVRITVQAQYAHEHDHVDKFIVQSMKVSDCLGDKVITESMFHEEPGKVVDEVNLLVVYEPTKADRNFTSSDDTNMPAEEVPEMIKRKIVESPSGKVKGGSSEKVDVAFMDINSRPRGQFKKQTKHRILYPIQSFSHQSPTNMTFLEKESDRVVDVTRGAMGSLLHKLGKLVTEDYNLENSMKREVEYFSQELTRIHLDLPKMGKVDGLKLWVNEVREMSYKIEDMVDSFMVDIEPHSSRSGFGDLTHEGLKLLGIDMITHRDIGDVISDIKDQVQAMAYKQNKYNFDVKNVVASTTINAPIDPRMSIYINKEQLVGIEARRDDVIRLFEEDIDVSKQGLVIVSIVGLGGLGKTTLARAVYDKLKAQYHYIAFIPVGQNPDVKKLLVNILITFGNKFNAVDVGLEVWQLVAKIQDLLEDKRYLIVIDDIWDCEAWGIIGSAFPRNKYHSRVITTTRIERVARACCEGESKNVYWMKPLGEEDSRRLFLRRIFGPVKDCPDAQKEIATDILKRCGGMPLAINSVASLLAGEPESTWDYARKTLGAMTEGDDHEKMKKILDLSYIHLPDYLKTCMLYVCMYPEDREIDKKYLLRQWVAEGFVHVSASGGLDAEDVAEKYLKELINRCLIQPGKIDYNNEVLSCRVHDIILDLMRSKSTEMNFSHLIDGSKYVTEAHGQIRRVSVQCDCKKDMRILETINIGSLSHVRSAKYCPVRDVKLSEGGIVLPDGIDRLKSLRTLEGVDVGRSSVENIKGISKLTNLTTLHVYVRGNIEGPDMLHLDALHSSICILSSSLKVLTFELGYFSVNVPAVWGSRTLFPRGSHIRELDLRACKFERCPKWIGQLHHLYKFTILVREVADSVSIVAGLPSLCCFKLLIESHMRSSQKEESVVIPGGRAFKALKHLSFYCQMAKLTFEAGAMPKLEKLQILFGDDMVGPESIPVGIQHLPAGILKYIWLRVASVLEVYEDHDHYCHYMSVSSQEYLEQGQRTVRALLKGAFKPHHPAAGFRICFDRSVSDKDAGDEDQDNGKLDGNILPP